MAKLHSNKNYLIKHEKDYSSNLPLPQSHGAHAEPESNLLQEKIELEV